MTATAVAPRRKAAFPALRAVVVRTYAAGDPPLAWPREEPAVLADRGPEAWPQCRYRLALASELGE